MLTPSVSYKTLRALRPSLVATAFAAAAFLAAASASADECMNDSDCGFGLACETVVTSSITTGAGGAAGTAGTGTAGTGTAGTGTAGTGTAGTGTAGTTGSGNGGAPAGGMSGDVPGGTGGTGGAAPRPGPVCGNGYCETPTESPATCAADCVFTTICTGAICTDDAQCASGYACPSPGSVGTGGGPNTVFCGDSLCSTNEDTLNCPFDCDPNYRRCAPGTRGCQSDLDCVAGYACVYSGGGGTGGTSGASGSAGMMGGGAGISQVGMCLPGGTGGAEGGTTGVGGDYYGGVGGTTAGTTGAGGASGGVGGTNGADEGDVIVTHGGCSMANGSASSSFASLLLGAVALLRFGRRRVSRTR